MDKIKIKFPDGSEEELQKGIKGIEILEKLPRRVREEAVAIKVNNEVYDLIRPINHNANIRVLTYEDDEGKEIFRHSAAHILAIAVKRLFPKAKLAIGPAVKDGFYYDFDIDKPFTPEDLEKLEQEIKRIIAEDIKFERLDLHKDKAKEHFKEEPYKLSLIDDLGDDIVTIYKNGEFMDLCKGPHLPSTKKVKAIKLMKVAGAYWKGKAENKQLQRIYGVAFPSEKDLKEYLRMLEEAEKRDHRKLGKQLELFSFHDEAPGFPFFLDKGLAVLNTLTNLWRKVHQKDGYLEIRTPLILNRKLWETSGHWENYRENMYTTKIDDEDYAIKPMNCPGGMLVYKEKVHSYRDFPLKIGEIGLVHRHELSGTLSGLFRVRAFTQDDAHIFMTEDQITEQILGVFKLVEDIYSLFNLEYHFELSTRPEKSIGSDEQWDFTTEALRKALELSGKRFLINEGDGAFYGPKVDIHIKDSIGRTWQCGTIQLDMSLPERFNLTYEGKDGKKHRPIMIHRVIYGSFERFFGILLEHYAGKLPIWLSPVQIKILTVADRFNDYAAKLKQEFENQGFRVELDTRSESIGKKVREAQLQKINYILVVGEKELNANTASVRTRENKVLGAMPVEKFIEKIKQEMTESSKGWF